MSEIGENRCLGPQETSSFNLGPVCGSVHLVYTEDGKNFIAILAIIPLSPSQGNPFVEYGLDRWLILGSQRVPAHV